MVQKDYRSYRLQFNLDPGVFLVVHVTRYKHLIDFLNELKPLREIQFPYRGVVCGLAEPQPHPTK